MLNEIFQWIAILGIAFLVLYPIMHNIVKDFKEAEEEE